MTPKIEAYFEWENQLLKLLEKHQGQDSAEEDALLDDADVLWYSLSEEEKTYLRENKGPHFAAICAWREKVGA